MLTPEEQYVISMVRHMSPQERQPIIQDAEAEILSWGYFDEEAKPSGWFDLNRCVWSQQPIAAY
jgi:hypothetical protein